MLVNLSVWESVETLRAFTYRSDHVVPFRRRAAWFEPHTEPHLVLWWVPAGHLPGVAEAIDRLAYLRRHGPTARAFTFSRTFPAPGTTAAELPVSERSTR